jgi:ATP-dependent Clp protease ATP-binding subunit ClpC
LKLTDGALKYIVKKGYSEEYGARPVKRLIQTEIEDIIAESILDGASGDGSEILIDEKDGKLSF